jgi:hypothetical protein
MCKPLFPFYISSAQASYLAEKDPEYADEVASKSRFINELRVHGKITEDKMLELSAWASSDNGFCQSSGTFWKKTLGLSKELLNSFVDHEIMVRAESEQRKAEELSRAEIVQHRAIAIRKALGL